MRINLSIFLLLFFLNFDLFSQIFEIKSDNDTIFVGEKIVFRNISDKNSLSLFYSIDSAKNWTKITNNLTDEFEWQLPFSLSSKIQFKAIKTSIIQPELIWEESFAHNGEVRSASFSEDGKMLITLGSDAKIKIWDIYNRKCIDSLELNTNEYTYDAKFFHSNDKIIFSIQNISYIWNRKSKTYNSFYTIGDFIRKIDVHPKENRFAVISNDNNLALFIETFLLPIPTNLRLYSNSKYGNSYSIRYSKDGKQIAIATYNGKIIICDIGKNTEQDYTFEKSPIFAVSFLSDANKIVFGGASTKLQIYNTTTSQLDVLEPIFLSSIKEIKYNNVREDLCAASFDSTLKIWNNNKFISEIKEPYSLMTCDISNTGDTLLTAGRYNRFRLWKNYQFQIDSQVIEFEYRQKLYCNLKFEKSYFNPNEQIKILSNIHSDFSDTLSKIGNWEISQQLTFPAQLIEINDKGAYTFSDNFNKLLYDKTKIFDFKQELFDTIFCRTLYSSNNYDSIKITKINLNPKDNFYPIIQNKEIKVNYYCGKEYSPQIEFKSDSFDFELISQNNNYIEIGIVLDKEKVINLEIINLLGNKNYQRILSSLQKGNNTVRININQLLDGIYFLTLKSESTLKTKKIYIIR